MDKVRCGWCSRTNEVYINYHDNEWGVPCRDDGTLFELLILESFQAGLSWETILNKREAFRRAFEGFDPEKVSRFDDDKISALMKEKGIVRNLRKITAAINNAAVFSEIQREWGSFAEYIWHFTSGKVVYEWDRTSSPLSDEVCRHLKGRGMMFIGTTTVYAYLQAIGVINSHEPTCFLHREGK